MNSLKTIKQILPEQLAGRRVLVRLDLNVPLAANVITNDFRLRQSLPILQFLINAGAQVTAISHLSDSAASLAPVQEYLKKILPAVELKENLRRESGEENNDLEFAKKLADNFDLFVFDAFAVAHRQHASVVGVPEFLPSYLGPLMEKEIVELSRAFQPRHPFGFILGGIKFATKVPLLEKFLPMADWLFIGGDLVNNFASTPYVNQPKIIVPSKVIRSEGKIKDIDPRALTEIAEKIKNAKLILWNGPLGNFENGFMAGTEALAKMIAAADGYSIVGGGDTVAAIEKLGLQNDFDFISTGGGAMLDFLAHGTLPGLEALEKSQQKFGIAG